MTIVEVFPFFQLLSNINIVSIIKELIELLLICKMRSLNFSIQMRACFPYVQMADTHILTMPVEGCLKFMPIISLDSMYPKGELISDVIHKVNCALLVMFIVNL
jgi:hypothetical protein